MTSPLVKRAPSAVRTRAFRPIQFPRVLTSQSRNWKKTVDVILAGALALAVFPVAVAIALAILLESGGPVLFEHERIGRGNRRFLVRKFRTMVMDGEKLLAKHLAENPEAAIEWDLTHKLKKDPRVTRVGRFLRRTSLDELPQLWNVLWGEMSMVGPRPIEAAEVDKYGPAFRLYTQVLPGLTGLWQVSGRNDTTYDRRVELDTHYIRHWTPLMDLRVLIQTIAVVVVGKGAY